MRTAHLAPDARRDRADKDDATVPPLHHLGSDGLTDEEAALQIDVKDAVPVLLVDLADPPAVPHAGEDGEEIDVSEMFHSPSDGFVRARLAGDVEVTRDRLTTRRTDLVESVDATKFLPHVAKIAARFSLSPDVSMPTRFPDGI